MPNGKSQGDRIGTIDKTNGEVIESTVTDGSLDTGTAEVIGGSRWNLVKENDWRDEMGYQRFKDQFFRSKVRFDWLNSNPDMNIWFDLLTDDFKAGSVHCKWQVLVRTWGTLRSSSRTAWKSWSWFHSDTLVYRRIGSGSFRRLFMEPV